MDGTREVTEDRAEARPAPARPGLVVVFAGGAPCCHPIPVARGGTELGRDQIDDDSVSRKHAFVAFDGRWTVRDLGSRNGTWLDGEKVDGERVRGAAKLLRLGRVVALLVADVTPFAAGVRVEGDLVIGPRLAAAWQAIAVAARAGDVVHVRGETGAGKELAAARFHADSGGGPMVPVNCAAIPEGLAERLLFGAVKGAYSGAERDTDGYVQAADGGTLFLDEIAELDPQVQAKLLRVLESREVMPLGGVRAHKVALRVVSATHRDLRDAVAEGEFRDDLYFRLGRPEVVLPALRDRLEELPWLIARAAGDVKVQASYVEACALRPWPGNVRELLVETRRAAHAARDGLSAVDLDPRAGTALRVEPAAARDDAAIEQALADAGGNVTAAARALGMHRNQLRRWVAKREGS